MSGDQADYITDAPIFEPPQDRFSRAPFAERIARTIVAQRDPASLVVGIYGPWGDGKTSVLNLIEHTLHSTEGVVPVRFNPWRLGNESEMFVGFFETLAEALELKLTTGKERLGSALKNYGALLKPIPFTGGAIGEAAATAGAALSETSLAKARARIEKILAESTKRVVILMDDLDRLDKGEIQAIFRLVKVAADFQHTAYVLAFDDSVVADALAERYAAGTSHGTSFMEKIIQLGLHLPPVGRDVLRRVTLETVAVALEQAGLNLSQVEIGEFVSTFDVAVAPQIKTPRMGKRYGNAVLFALPMIGDEVRPVDLLLVEALRIFYPRLYEWIRDHEHQVLGHRSTTPDQGEAANAVLRSAITDSTLAMPLEAAKGAQLLLTRLFPRTESAWQNKGWGTEWDAIWAKEKRIASKQYFRRYFSYTVPAGDVPDADVNSLIALLDDPDGDGAAIADVARSLLETGGPETLLEKLRVHAEGLSTLAAHRLALVLAAISDVFPQESGFGFSTMERAARMTSKLVKRVAPDDRVTLLSSVMKAAPSLPFAADVLRWVRPRDDEQADALSLDETAEAGRVLVERIAEVWDGDDPFTALGEGTAATLHVWSVYGDISDLRECLARRINDDLSNAFRIMESFLGKGWSMETGAPLIPEFRREAYGAVVEYIDPADVFIRLQQRFGDRVGTGDFYGFQDLPSDERLANEFAFIHRAVLDQKEAKEEDHTSSDTSDR